MRLDADSGSSGVLDLGAVGIQKTEIFQNPILSRVFHLISNFVDRLNSYLR